MQWLEVILALVTFKNFNTANEQIIPVVYSCSYTAFSLGDLQNNYSKKVLYVDGPCSTFGDQLVINFNQITFPLILGLLM